MLMTGHMPHSPGEAATFVAASALDTALPCLSGTDSAMVQPTPMEREKEMRSWILCTFPCMYSMYLVCIYICIYYLSVYRKRNV